MPYDSEACDLAAGTDDAIRDFGMAPTCNNLNAMAEEMERRRNVYAGGLVQAGRIVLELRRRALEARS